MEYNAFIQFYDKLITVFHDKSYPSHFVLARIISPDDVHDMSNLLDNDRAVQLLKNISGPLKCGEKQSFYKMLEIMEIYGEHHVQQLAENIKAFVESAETVVAPIEGPTNATGNVTSSSVIDFSDCDDISAAFARLTAEISKVLEKVDFDIGFLWRAIVQQENVPKGVQFPDDVYQKIQAAQDLDTLLYLLAGSKHWSWVDLRLLEPLIESLGIREAKDLINKYKEDIFSIKLSDVLDKMFVPQQKKIKDDYASRVASKLGKDANEMTVGDLSKFATQLETIIMDINDGSCVLEHLNTGCLEIHWLIPVHYRFHAYKSALNNRHKFCDIHLQYLHIEPYPPIYDPFTIQPTMLSNLLHLSKPIASTAAEVIDHYYCFLSDNLDNNAVCKIMLELKLLTDRDLGHAKMHSDYQQNKFLLDQLLIAGTASIIGFCHMLQDMKNQQELGHMLLSAIKSIPAEDAKMVMDRQLSGTPYEPTSSEEDDTDISPVYQPEVFLAAKKVHIRFLNMVAQLKQMLKDCDPKCLLTTCNKLIVNASHLEAIPLLGADYLEDLDDADIEEIFNRLAFLWTWYNHSILRALLEACSCQDSIKILDDFNSKIDTYQPLELFAIPPPSMKMAPSLMKIFSSVFTVLSIRGEYDQDEPVHDVATIVIEKFNISSHALQLLAVRSNPLMLYWMIPKSVVTLISEGVNEHLDFLKERGFSEVAIYPNTILFATDNISHGSFALLSIQPQLHNILISTMSDSTAGRILYKDQVQFTFGEHTNEHGFIKIYCIDVEGRLARIEVFDNKKTASSPLYQIPFENVKNIGTIEVQGKPHTAITVQGGDTFIFSSSDSNNNMKLLRCCELLHVLSNYVIPEIPKRSLVPQQYIEWHSDCNKYDAVDTIPSLKDLYQHIPQYGPDWKMIGTLELSSVELIPIVARYPTNVKWEKWLEVETTALWGKLFTESVIESPAVSCSAPDKGVEPVIILSKRVREVNIQKWLRVAEDTWPPYTPKMYTPLVLIQHLGHRNLKQSTAMGEFVEQGYIVTNVLSKLKHPKLDNHEPLQEALDTRKVTKDVAVETSDNPERRKIDEFTQFLQDHECLSNLCYVVPLNICMLEVYTTASWKKLFTVIRLPAISCSTPDKGVICLGDLLKVDNLLQELNLGDNQISDYGMLLISDILLCNKELTMLKCRSVEGGTLWDTKTQCYKTLDLSRCGLSTKGISDLCELLKVNNSLQEVEMGYIDDDGMSLINNSLQEVEMGYIDDDGMSLFFYGLLCNNAELRMLNCGLFVEISAPFQWKKRKMLGCGTFGESQQHKTATKQSSYSPVDTQHIKILVVGDRFTGKSSLIQRTISTATEFCCQYNYTHLLNCNSKTVQHKEKLYSVTISDLTGIYEERLHQKKDWYLLDHIKLVNDPIQMFCVHQMCYDFFMKDWVQLLRFKSENKELKHAIERRQKENVELKNRLDETTQLQNIVKEIDNKLNMLSESFEKRIRKEHNRYQRKLKIIRKEREDWKEQYDQLKKKLEQQSENQKNREAYWATRCEDLKKQNCDLKDYIALFPKVLEAVKKNAQKVL